MLAYQVFKFIFWFESRPLKCCYSICSRFTNLIRNRELCHKLTLLKEALRPLWEQHDNWEEKYYKKSTRKVKGNEDIDEKDEYVEMQMYDFNGQSVNYHAVPKAALMPLLVKSNSCLQTVNC